MANGSHAPSGHSQTRTVRSHEPAKATDNLGPLARPESVGIEVLASGGSGRGGGRARRPLPVGGRQSKHHPAGEDLDRQKCSSSDHLRPFAASWYLIWAGRDNPGPPERVLSATSHPREIVNSSGNALGVVRLGDSSRSVRPEPRMAVADVARIAQPKRPPPVDVEWAPRCSPSTASPWTARVGADPSTAPPVRTGPGEPTDLAVAAPGSAVPLYAVLTPRSGSCFPGSRRVSVFWFAHTKDFMGTPTKVGMGTEPIMLEQTRKRAPVERRASAAPVGPRARRRSQWGPVEIGPLSRVRIAFRWASGSSPCCARESTLTEGAHPSPQPRLPARGTPGELSSRLRLSAQGASGVARERSDNLRSFPGGRCCHRARLGGARGLGPRGDRRQRGV